MKSLIQKVFLLYFFASPAIILAQSAELFNPGEVPSSFISEGAPLVWTGPENVLLDNGPLVNGAGTGAGGADESILQTSLGLTTLGVGHQISVDNLIAENFTVPAGLSWSIDEIVFFAYQTGSALDTTFDDYRVQILDGPPGDPASSVVFGDLTTNVLRDSVFSNIYRVEEGTSGISTDRPIMANTADIDTVLGPGVYYLVWQSGGTLGSGPWAPPITINGEISTGDAFQSTDGGVSWELLLDGGDPDPDNPTRNLGLPFVIQGQVLSESQPVPALGLSGLMIMILALMATVLVFYRRF